MKKLSCNQSQLDTLLFLLPKIQEQLATESEFGFSGFIEFDSMEMKRAGLLKFSNEIRDRLDDLLGLKMIFSHEPKRIGTANIFRKYVIEPEGKEVMCQITLDTCFNWVKIVESVQKYAENESGVQA